MSIPLIASLAACGGSGGSKTETTTSVTVPNVVSDTVAQATTSLEAAGLTLGTETTATSSTVSSGDIISENPAAGTSVASGTAVSVVVSSGPAMVSVPNVVSDTVAQATTALEAVGLTLGTQTTASSSTVPSGEILSQNPAANTSVVAGTSVSVVVSSGPATATESVVHTFTGGSDGRLPKDDGLIQDSDGNFYGTTTFGGAQDDGTVFKITPAGVESVLYSFAGSGNSDGSDPYAGLMLGSDGNFYGTTVDGGANCGGGGGCGTVFKITPAGVETVLYSFAGGSDGSSPYGALIEDSAGNLYGTTFEGGASGDGIVFKVTPAGVETVLHSFTGGTTDGSEPFGSLVNDNGTFYGTTTDGGTCGCGTFFSITPAGAETLLYSFGTKVGDGSEPSWASLILGNDGNFYGTTVKTATNTTGGTNPYGTVFKVTPAGAETILYSFPGSAGGGEPFGGVIQGNDGNFYGTTSQGGTGSCTNGCGTVFQVTPAGVGKILYSFAGGNDGSGPFGGLFQTSNGNFYGATWNGGASDDGTVFEIVP